MLFHTSERKILKRILVMSSSSRPDVLYKKVVLEISQNSQETTSARVSFVIKLQASFFHKTSPVLRNVSNRLIQDHHVIKGAWILTLEKLPYKELYSILITNFTNKPSSTLRKSFLTWNSIRERFVSENKQAKKKLHSMVKMIVNKSFFFQIRKTFE